MVKTPINNVPPIFHEYVKPSRNPQLSQFCHDLTGIKQEWVDRSSEFPEVWTRYLDWLKALGAYDNPESFAFLTCGDWDLKTMLPTQHDKSRAERHIAPIPSAIFDHRINIKSAFRSHYRAKYAKGMAAMLKRLGIKLEGRHHSGIDDCRNIARIVVKMLEDGWTPVPSSPATNEVTK